MRVSFCITCMGRLHHLRQTLSKNIVDNSDHPDVEFVILDYNSGDGLEDWVRSEMMREVQSGAISYWKESTADRWRMPQAKNLAALAATGEIVCNLDADNFTGTGYAGMLNDIFSSLKKILVTNFKGGEYGGRIAILKKDFIELRGYDEELSYGWGWEDDDFKQRAIRAGCIPLKLQAPEESAIFHEDAERLKFMPDWKNLQEAHAAQSRVFERRGTSNVVNPKVFGNAQVRNLDGSQTLTLGVY